MVIPISGFLRDTSSLLQPFRMPMISILFVTLLFFFNTTHGKGGGFKCSAGFSKSICLPDEYNKFDLPNKQANEISVSLDIDEILRINDKGYSITIAVYFNIEWHEPRLTTFPEFGASNRHNNSMNPVMVPVAVDYLEDLWLPNIFIYNIESFKVLRVLSKLDGLWIDTDKKVLYSQAAHITFMCIMNFGKFPFDTQKCKFRVGSYSYDDSKLNFITKNAGYVLKTNKMPLDYGISIVPLASEDTILDYGALGNFSLAGFEMNLSRYAARYVVDYYIPSCLFVMISWLSFLIPIDVISGRMGILAALFLILVNIFNSVTANTPKAEGVTAIEVWMSACLLFVFGALLEYSSILLMKQHYGDKSEENKEKYQRIDTLSLMGFPIVFLIFNIIYWLVVLV